MTSRVTKSGRVVKSASEKQSKLDALEILARQRRGEKVDIGIKEDEPLFEEIDEDTYRRSKKNDFVVGFDSEEEDESDQDFIDDGDYADDGPPKPKHTGRRRKKAIEDCGDPKQKSMRSFLGSSSSRVETKSLKTNLIQSGQNKTAVDQDDVLKTMLLDVPESTPIIAPKPMRVAKRQPIVKAPTSPDIPRPSIKTKASFDIITPKRPKMTNQTQSKQPGMDDWLDDDFDATPIDGVVLKMEPQLDDFKRPSSQELVPIDSCFPLNDGDDDDEKFENDTAELAAVPLDDDLKANLEFHDMNDGRKYSRFYWYDCCEDQAKYPGVVYFFGRIYATTAKRFVSSCVVVKNIKRTVYLLISEKSSYDQVVDEFTAITAKRFKIKNFTCEKVTKKYAFSVDPKTPLVADYVKVEYPSTCPLLPSDHKGSCFSNIFNVNQSPMEKMILELKLRGPCWMRMIEPVSPPVPLTWSRMELILESPDLLQVDENSGALQAPYFCTLSLTLRTYPNPITHHNEIIAIACMVNTTFNLDQCLKRNNKASGHFMIMSKPAASHKELRLPFDFNSVTQKLKTRFELVESERDLLQAFMDKFSNLDPDIVVGHDLLNFDYETLAMRMRMNKVGIWSKLGRFKRTELPSTKAAFRYMFSGRVICDIRSSAMELIHARSYDLSELVSQVLRKTRIEYNHTSIVESFKSSQALVSLLNATWEDNDSIFSILVELNVIPLALKITNITGNILSRTLAAGRSERNEYLLLHAFHDDNFICPEKQILRNNRFSKSGLKPGGDTINDGESKEFSNPGRKKAAYAGGLVLEPNAGYYDTCILLMDFNSLYPSIIQEFNICFSTVKRPVFDGANPGGEIIADVPEESITTGILPAQLKSLVDRRRMVKKLLGESKSENDKLMLDIEQRALKLTANSMYGCLGFEQSRFYAKHLASLVTFKGREILMSTKAMVERLGYEVIYGDTDSLMINTKLVDYDEVIQRGNSIKLEINRTFKLLEIDIDGVYKPLLLLKKKNYAGASISKLSDGNMKRSIETKGLDTVRRDRAVIAKQAGEKVLSMILNESDRDISQIVEDIHTYLKQLGQDIRNGLVPKEHFLISKQLNKNPDEYKDTKGIGHVAVALRYNQDTRRTRKMKSGDTVEYVVCTDGTTESANQRAYSLDELNERKDTLSLDTEYYLCQQVHPVMARICDKLPTTNAYVLAEMLSVEKSSLLHIRRDDCDTVKRDQLLSKGEARFNSCRPLILTCPNCNMPDEIRSRTRKTTAPDSNKKQLELSLSHCPQCRVRYAIRMNQVVVQVIALIRQLTNELYATKFVCDNPECGHWTRNLLGQLTSDLDGASMDPSHSPDARSASMHAQLACDLCESPMVAEMDDRKLDLQLSFYKYLFEAERECDTQPELQGVTQDLLAMYEACWKEVDYALRCSFVNNVDAYSMFSMVCSGRQTESSSLPESSS